MMRYGVFKNWLVMAVTLAATVAGPGSYLCRTDQGGLRTEYAWSGGCQAWTGGHANDTWPLIVTASRSPCGACADTAIHLDSSPPSHAKRAGSAMSQSVCVTGLRNQQVRPAGGLWASQAACDPPPDLALSAICAIVLIV